jgi:hypothetical protein
MAGGPGEIVIPFMGDSVPDGVIAAILKKPGDAVAVDEIIAQIETDKVCDTALLAFKAVYHPIFAWQVIYTYSRGVNQIFMSKI